MCLKKEESWPENTTLHLKLMQEIGNNENCTRHLPTMILIFPKKKKRWCHWQKMNHASSSNSKSEKLWLNSKALGWPTHHIMLTVQLYSLTLYMRPTLHSNVLMGSTQSINSAKLEQDIIYLNRFLAAKEYILRWFRG